MEQHAAYLKTTLVCITLTATLTARSNTPVEPAQSFDVQGAISFVASAATFQAYFDSVVQFCDKYTPQTIVAASRDSWNRENSDLLLLREQELGRLVELAKKNNAAPDAVQRVADLVSDTYAKEMQGNRMFKDLTGSSNLEYECPKRLGVMLSQSMRFQRLAPDAYAYYLSVRGQPR